MNKSYAENILNAIKEKNDPELEKEFIIKSGNIVSDILANFAMQYNIIGVTGVSCSQSKDGYYNLFFSISNGFLSILPCIDQTTSIKYRKKYIKQIKMTGDMIGFDYNNWPSSTMDMLGENKLLIVSIWPGKIRKNKADFSIGVFLSYEGKTVSLKEVSERSIQSETDPIIFSVSTNEEKLRKFLYGYFMRWIIGIGCWETTRDRRVEFYANSFRNIVFNELNNWDTFTFSVPHEYFGIIFWTGCQEDIARLHDSKFKDSCNQIVGNVMAPGYPAAFIVIFDIGNDNDGMEITGYGPIKYDPQAYFELSTFIKPVRKTSPIFNVKVSENEFDSNAEMEPAQKRGNIMRIDESAKLNACNFLQRIGGGTPAL